MNSPRFVLVAAVLFLAASGVSSAQQAATVSGEVVDDSGLVIPGAAVTATNIVTGAEERASTDSNGAYQLTLDPGTYTISAESPGFEIGIADGVELAAGQSLERSFRLELSVVTETIVVIGSRAAPRSVTESTVPVDVINIEGSGEAGKQGPGQPDADRDPLVQHQHATDQRRGDSRASGELAQPGPRPHAGPGQRQAPPQGGSHHLAGKRDRRRLAGA